MKKYGKYYVTIGLEIHVALQTQSKLFSRSANSFDSSMFALLDAGVPGILPILSDMPVKMAVAFALSTKATVAKYSEFERKHYFYPDLPLGYQITQQNKPIMIGGVVPIKTQYGERLIQIEHAHLECDAAKSLHDIYNEYTAIDLSRCASPLLEIVSTPCMHSPEEAKEYAKTVHALALFLGICDGKMEEGSFRVDASISLHTEEGKLGTRVENKNISSFSFLETALNYEIERQSEILDNGGQVVMETRLFDEVSMTTKSMRTKETVDEYRFMPDPDIPPLVIDENFIEQVKKEFLVDYFELRESLKIVLNTYQLDSEDVFLATILSSPYKEKWYDIALGKHAHSEKLLRLLGYWLPEVIAKITSDKLLGWHE
jgi:aspartyl-tRNA(Asn)/glutamyl-tRNA(Gln) amidotransferase subunit B